MKKIDLLLATIRVKCVYYDFVFEECKYGHKNECACCEGLIAECNHPDLEKVEDK